MGELGLAGELRRVRDLPAAALGGGPARLRGRRRAGSRGGEASPAERRVDGMQVMEVPDVASALRMLSLSRSR